MFSRSVIVTRAQQRRVIPHIVAPRNDAILTLRARRKRLGDGAVIQVADAELAGADADHRARRLALLRTRRAGPGSTARGTGSRSSGGAGRACRTRGGSGHVVAVSGRRRWGGGALGSGVALRGGGGRALGAGGGGETAGRCPCCGGARAGGAGGGVVGGTAGKSGAAIGLRWAGGLEV